MAFLVSFIGLGHLKQGNNYKNAVIWSTIDSKHNTYHHQIFNRWIHQTFDFCCCRGLLPEYDSCCWLFHFNSAHKISAFLISNDVKWAHHHSGTHTILNCGEANEKKNSLITPTRRNDKTNNINWLFVEVLLGNKKCNKNDDLMFRLCRTFTHTIFFSLLLFLHLVEYGICWIIHRIKSKKKNEQNW